jgi:hypothetical protein
MGRRQLEEEAHGDGKSRVWTQGKARLTDSVQLELVIQQTLSFTVPVLQPWLPYPLCKGAKSGTPKVQVYS